METFIEDINSHNILNWQEHSSWVSTYIVLESI